MASHGQCYIGVSGRFPGRDEVTILSSPVPPMAFWVNSISVRRVFWRKKPPPRIEAHGWTYHSFAVEKAASLLILDGESLIFRLTSPFFPRQNPLDVS